MSTVNNPSISSQEQASYSPSKTLNVSRRFASEDSLYDYSSHNKWEIDDDEQNQSTQLLDQVDWVLQNPPLFRKKLSSLPKIQPSLPILLQKITLIRFFKNPPSPSQETVVSPNPSLKMCGGVLNKEKVQKLVNGYTFTNDTNGYERLSMMMGTRSPNEVQQGVRRLKSTFKRKGEGWKKSDEESFVNAVKTIALKWKESNSTPTFVNLQKELLLLVSQLLTHSNFY